MTVVDDSRLLTLVIMDRNRTDGASLIEERANRNGATPKLEDLGQYLSVGRYAKALIIQDM